MPNVEKGSNIGARGAEVPPNFTIRSSADLTIFRGTKTFQDNLPGRLAQESRHQQSALAETPLPRGRGRV